MAWFSFTGTNPSNPAHYTLQGSEPSCGLVEEKMCAIQAAKSATNNDPVLNVAILSEIADALQLEENTTNVRLKARP